MASNHASQPRTIWVEPIFYIVLLLLVISLVNEVHHHLYHHILFFCATFGYHQCQGDESVVCEPFGTIFPIEDAVVI